MREETFTDKPSGTAKGSSIINVLCGNHDSTVISAPFPDIAALLAFTGMQADGAADNCPDYIA